MVVAPNAADQPTGKFVTEVSCDALLKFAVNVYTPPNALPAPVGPVGPVIVLTGPVTPLAPVGPCGPVDPATVGP